MRNLLLTPAALALLAAPAIAGGLDALPPQPTVLPPMQVTAGAYDWTGLYAGVSAGTTRTRHRRETWGERDIVERGQESRPYNKADLHRDLTSAGGCTDPHREYEIDYAEFGFGYTIECQYIVGNEPDDGWAFGNVVGHDPVVTDEWEEVVGTERFQTGAETVRSSHATWGLFAGYRHQFASGGVLGAEAAWHRAATDQIEVKGQAGYALGRALPYLTTGWEFETGKPLYGVGLDYALTSRWIAGSEYARFGDSDRLTARIAVRF